MVLASAISSQTVIKIYSNLTNKMTTPAPRALPQAINQPPLMPPGIPGVSTARIPLRDRMRGKDFLFVRNNRSVQNEHFFESQKKLYDRSSSINRLERWWYWRLYWLSLRNEKRKDSMSPK